jgi:hypothetical protein
MNEKQARIWKEAVVAYFKELSGISHRRHEDNYEKSQ